MSTAQSSSAGIGVPRSLVIADAWRGLTGVEPFTGRTGLPLARTVKLVLDPLVIRPTQRPHLGAALLSVDAAAELRVLLEAAADDLAAAAAWFTHLKRARRAAHITQGNPQDLYFQRAFELARTQGAPGPDAARHAGEMVAEVHGSGRITAADLRAYLTDPRRTGELRQAIARTWAAADRAADAVPVELVAELLDACADEDAAAAAFDALVARSVGSAGAQGLERTGAARAYGLTVHDRPTPPEVGTSASKSALPPPFDRSILERLFAALPAFADSASEVPDVVAAEVERSGGGWQLADEASRVLLAAAGHATSALAGEPARTDAAERLVGRWRREPFVQRSLRLPEPAVHTDGVREAVMRRLWVRVHGRELREEPVTGIEAWDLIDGALRSVILDRRGLVKSAIARQAESEMAS